MKTRPKIGPDCYAAVNAASGERLNKDAINDAFQRIFEYRETLKASGQIDGMADKLKSFAEREAERTKIAAAMQKRHAALNILVRDRQTAAIEGMIKAGLTPRKAILAILEGTQRGVEGGRNSVAALDMAYQARYLGGLMAELQANRPHLIHTLRDPRMDADIMREMGELREGGKPGITGNDDAKYVAKVFSSYLEMSRTDLNRLGASIGKLDGYSGAQTHDDVKMLKAGKEAWVASILPKLDIARTFPDVTTAKEIEDALSGVYDTLITGLPNKPTPGELGQRVNPANLAKRLGKSRVLHFKDADAAMAYRDQFGYGNTVSGIIGALRNSSRTAAAMESLGPNPDVMFTSLVDGLRRKIKDASANQAELDAKIAKIDRDIADVNTIPSRSQSNGKGVVPGMRSAFDVGELSPSQKKYRIAQLEARKEELKAAGFMTDAEKIKQMKGLDAQAGQLRNSLDVATGLISRPVNVTAAKIGADIRAVESMAKLGAAVFSSISDTVTPALASMFRGSGFFSGLTKQLDGTIRGRPKGEQAEITFLLGEGFDGIIGHIVSPAAANDGPVGKLSALQEKFFRWNGLSWWTDVQRGVAGRVISAEMGMRAKSAYADLPANYRHVLGLHGIDEAKWEAIRKVDNRTVDGKDYITPDRIRELPDDALEALAAPRVAKANADLDSRIKSRNAASDKEAEWVAGRKAKLDEWQAEADKRLESMLAGNEIRTAIEKQTAERQIELEKAKIEAAQVDVEMLDAARGIAQGDIRNLLDAVADGSDALKIAEKTDAILNRIGGKELRAGESLGTRRQRAQMRIRQLEKDIAAFDRKAAKKDRSAIDAVNERFQARVKELNAFIDKSFSREQARLEAEAKDIEAQPERIKALYEDTRRDLELSVLRFFADETAYGVIEVDNSTRRIMTQGNRPGTFAGEALRFVAQFKGFPLAFTTRVGGRAIYGMRKDATILDRTAHIGAMIGGMTMAGYMAMTMKDMMKGYWPPRDPTDPATWAAAFIQGGAAGIYGDYLFAQTNRFGGGVLETTAGPVIGSAADLVDISLAMRDVAVGKLTGSEANFPAARALTWATGNTPFANLFYVRPALDYLFLNSMREAASPGFMRKQAKRRREDYGQTKAPFLPDSLRPFN